MKDKAVFDNNYRHLYQLLSTASKNEEKGSFILIDTSKKNH